MDTLATQTTACPAWCTVEHVAPGGFHAGPNVSPTEHPIRLFQDDRAGAPQGVVVAGHLLTEAQAHELGMALVRAGDAIRQAQGR